MRVAASVFLLFISFSGWTQSLPTKKVTIELANISLEKALTILSLSYGVEFSYSDDVVPTQKIVNLSIQDEDIITTLEKLLVPLNLGYKVSNNRILLKKASFVLTQTIRGKITDEVTHASIPGASILVQLGESQLGASSDTTGKFKLTDIPVGRVSIVVSCIGYDTRTVNNILLGTGKELVIDVPLKESITAMNEVVITAHKNETIPGDGVALTSSKSFSVEDTKRYAGSMGDPARMVTAFAGVTASNDESNALVVRGNSPRGMLWRIEGIEVPNPNHFTSEGASGGVVSILSPNMIERSDFLTGAFPAQYGNALSGVFDINLRAGNNQKREYSLQAGLLGMEASAEGPISKARSSSYLVNYRYSTLSILDKLNFDLNDVGQYKNYQDVGFKIYHPTSKSGSFSLFGIGGRSRSNKALDNLFDRSNSDLGVIGLTYKKKIGDTGYLETALSMSASDIGKDSEISEPNALVQVEERYTKSYTRASVLLKKRLSPRYVLEGGITHSLLDFDFYLRNRDPGNTPYQVIVNFSERGSTSITQGFLFARQYFSPSLFGFYGVHFLNFALTTDRSIEPRVGLRWQPSEKAAWNVAFGKHSKIENLQYYLSRDHQTGGNEVQINKNLSFTRANHFVIGYEQTFFLHHKAKAELYYQRLYNAPALQNDGLLYSSINEDTGFITDTLVNTGSGKNYGIELSLERSFTGNFYYLMNASFYESKFSVDGKAERNTSYNGNHTLHFLVGKEFASQNGKHRFGINLKVTSAGGRPYVPIDLEKSKEQGSAVYFWDQAFEKKLPDHFRSDIQLLYKKNSPRHSIEWRLDAQNFTDRRNAAYYYFDNRDSVVKLKKTIGFLPMLSCRIDF
jgi:hypothetical protein